MTAVSVVMPSFNHERFVKESIMSVLNQTFEDLELIVVDDGSTDGSNAIISSIQDPRLKHIPLSRNVGASEATNMGVRRASGRYVAVCNSDDVWLEDKLRTQVDILERLDDVAGVFSNVTWIDDEGTELIGVKLPPYHDVFARPAMSRAELLRTLVEEGNFLCHPSVLIRKKVYDDVGLYNNSLRQLPDYDMWVRVAQKFELLVIPDRLIRFRIHQNNTSGLGEDRQARTWAEHSLICNEFFRSVEPAVFYRSFGASAGRVALSSDREIFARELVSYLTSHQGGFEPFFKEIALKLCYEYNKSTGHDLIESKDVHSLSTYVGLTTFGLHFRAQLLAARSELAQGHGVTAHKELFGPLSRSVAAVVRRLRG